MEQAEQTMQMGKDISKVELSATFTAQLKYSLLQAFV